MTKKRRFNRVPANCAAEVEVRGDRQKKHNLRAMIRSVTCEGMGLYLGDEQRNLLRRGNLLTIRFSNGTRNLELPARIAWLASKPEGPFDLGIQFRFELTTATMRQAYANWVVGAIRSGRV